MLTAIALMLGAAVRPRELSRVRPPPSALRPAMAPVVSVAPLPIPEPPRVKRSPREVAAETLRWLRDDIGGICAHLEADIVEAATYICDRDRYERINPVPLMEAFTRLPGVRKERRRVNSDPALRCIKQRLTFRGSAHMRATIVWVDDEPVAATKPQKDARPAWKVPSGVAGHVASRPVQRQRGLDVMIGYEVPRRKAA